ncbi:hypothetical protein [Halosegnis marinus]|uniref:hypothetical protein n=1 Tax=Halosegnis marinus TaxID=3034023 RepID=UPI00361D3CFF
MQGGSGRTVGETAPTSPDPPDATPDAASADPGGTNGQRDADTSDGSVSRSADQSTDDYREEFTARLSI